MRAQVVLLRGDQILLARHVAADREYWVLPGGAVEDGETPEEAAIREVREETGLDIELDGLLFVDGPKRSVHFEIRQPRHTFLGRIVGGELCAVVDGETADSACVTPNGFLSGSSWMPFELAQYDAATQDTLRLVSRSLSTGKQEVVPSRTARP